MTPKEYREHLYNADHHSHNAELLLQQIPYEQQSADIRHALIKLAAARRGLADALMKVKT